MVQSVVSLRLFDITWLIIQGIFMFSKNFLRPLINLLFGGLWLPQLIRGGVRSYSQPKISDFTPIWTFFKSKSLKIKFQVTFDLLITPKNTFWTSFGCLNVQLSKVWRSDPVLLLYKKVVLAGWSYKRGEKLFFRHCHEKGCLKLDCSSHLR